MGLVNKLLLRSICSDAGIDFIHLGTPCLAILGDGLLKLFGPIRVGVEGYSPVLKPLAFLGKLPPPDVGVGDRLLAFRSLLMFGFGCKPHA